jgi:predicted nucleic acid-binding protein
VADRVVDTNIVSFLMKKGVLARRYQPHLVGHRLFVSFMTVAEMLEGAERARWGEARRKQLERILGGYLTIPSSRRLCELWARLRAERRRQPISGDDAWIAATALARDCPLVTHNPKDFKGISNLVVITEAASA